MFDILSVPIHRIARSYEIYLMMLCESGAMMKKREGVPG